MVPVTLKMETTFEAMKTQVYAGSFSYHHSASACPELLPVLRLLASDKGGSLQEVLFTKCSRVMGKWKGSGHCYTN